VALPQTYLINNDHDLVKVATIFHGGCNLNRDQSLVRSSLWSTQGSSGSHGKRELQWSGTLL